MTKLTPIQMETNWKLLNSLIQENLGVLDRENYKNLLSRLYNDYESPNVLFLGFFRAPAAKGNHHDYEGGLVQHLLEMWGVWKVVRHNFIPQNILLGDHINDDRVLRAIINHDLHKAYKTYELVRVDPWEVRYANNSSDQLLTSDVKSITILSKNGITLDDEQMNVLLWAEGGFAKIRPNWTSVLAKICYLLDEMSGNVIGRIEKNTLLDHRNPVE